MRIVVFLRNNGPEVETMKLVAKSLRTFGHQVQLRNPDFVNPTEIERFDGALAYEHGIGDDITKLTTSPRQRVAEDGVTFDKYTSPNFAGEEGLLLLDLDGDGIKIGDKKFTKQQIEDGDLGRFLLRGDGGGGKVGEKPQTPVSAVAPSAPAPARAKPGPKPKQSKPEEPKPTS